MANQDMEVKQGDQKQVLSVMPFDLIFMNPFSVMRRMTEEMDRALQTSNAANGGSALWAPAVEVSEIVREPAAGRWRPAEQILGLRLVAEADDLSNSSSSMAPPSRCRYCWANSGS